MSGGRLQPHVVVEGSPEIAPGTAVTAVFRRAGDWSTLVGWTDHRTGAIVGPPSKRYRGAAILDVVFGTLAVVVFHRHSPVMVAAVVLVASLAAVADLWRWRRACARLDAIRAAGPARSQG